MFTEDELYSIWGSLDLSIDSLESEFGTEEEVKRLKALRVKVQILYREKESV